MKHNVVIAGGSEQDAWLHAQAYRVHFGQARAARGDTGETPTDRVDVQFAGIWVENGARARAQRFSLKPYLRFEELLADGEVSLVELIAPTPGRTGKAIEAMKAGKHVLLGPPLARSAEEARILEEASRGSGMVLMVHDPWRFYPPCQRLEAAVRQQVIGRIQTIRMRTVLGGRGGWDPYLNPRFPGERKATFEDGEAVFWQEAFLKLSLAVRLFGPIEELCLSGTLPDPRGSACFLTFKHKTHATYGSLELVVSPGLTIRSAWDPQDHRIELTGTAGVLWLTRGPAQVRSEPTLSIYKGKNLFSYGNLPDGWELGFRGCARHFARLAESGRKDEEGLATARHVVECLRILDTQDGRFEARRSVSNPR